MAQVVREMNTTVSALAQAADSVLEIPSNFDPLAYPIIAKHWFGWCCCSLALGSTEAKTHCNSVVGVIQVQIHQDQQVTVEGAREIAPPIVVP